MPPSHYEHAVSSAVTRIGAGELKKVVLAREVEVQAPARYEPRLCGVASRRVPVVLRVCRRTGRGHVRGRQPGAAGPPIGPAREHGGPGRIDRAQRRSGRGRPSRRAFAPQPQGSRGECDRGPAAISRVLAPHAVWVTAAPEPVVVKVANIQHLATRSELSWLRPCRWWSWRGRFIRRRRSEASRGARRWS